MTRRQRARAARWSVYAASLLLVVLVVMGVDWAALQESFFDPELAREQFPEIVTQAAKNTVIFTTFGFALALVLGLILALMRLSAVLPYRWTALVYIEVLRGLPALLTILLIGFGLPIATGQQLPGTYTTGSVAIGMVGAAYIAETIRAGIQAVPRGQMEAARSLGMGHTRAMVTVIIPQAFRVVIPPLTNEFVLLLKDTSLISVLGVTAATKELTRFGRDGVIDNANSTPLVVAGLVYLAITIPLTQLARYVERRGEAAR
jgi:polar amino acid transport system permease protein